jgi:hypothetical protein
MSPATIQGSEYPLHKVLSDEFDFEIPLYQRPYAWTTEHATELFDDLQTSINNDHMPIGELDPYFFGSIVLIKTRELPRSEIIDGQQRLTTITILLGALREAIEDKEFGKGLTPFLYSEGSKVLGTDNRYRLRLRQRDETFFRAHIQIPGGIARLQYLDLAQLPDSQQRICENALVLLQKVTALSDEMRQRLAQFVVQRCYLVVVFTPDMDSAYRIFSVLNDRGLDLSHTDILKAELIGKAPEGEQATYTKRWEDAEEQIGRESFKDLFAHIRMIKQKAKMRTTVLKELREKLKGEEPRQFIDSTVVPLTNAYDTLKCRNYVGSRHAEEINDVLGWLNQIDNFDWMPPAILYLSQNGNEPDALLRFFTHLERLSAGLMILRAGINERLERYGALLACIEGRSDLFAPDAPLLLTEQQRNQILSTLDGEVYPIQRIRRYVLLRLDAALAGAGARYNYPVITVEHVLPQSPAQGSQWLQWFPTPEMCKLWTHRLANLVLLTQRKNSQAGNFEFDEKKQKYFNTKAGGVSPFVLTTQVLQKATWTPEILDARQKELIGQLKGIWQL